MYFCTKDYLSHPEFLHAVTSDSIIVAVVSKQVGFNLFSLEDVCMYDHDIVAVLKRSMRVFFNVLAKKLVKDFKQRPLSEPKKILKLQSDSTNV